MPLAKLNLPPVDVMVVPVVILVASEDVTVKSASFVANVPGGDVFVELLSTSVRSVVADPRVKVLFARLSPPRVKPPFLVTVASSDSSNLVWLLVITLSSTTYSDEQLFYFYDETEDVVKKYSSSTNTLSTTTDYYGRRGRASLTFQYKHNAGQSTRIDPSVSNIVDIYMLERTYDNLYRIWLQDGGTQPTPSTSDQLRISYSGVLNPLKSLSDQIVYHPVKYRILFGTQSDETLQATFKVVKNPNTNISNAIIKTRTISAINEFFALDNFDFGDTFYFTELAAYIHNKLAPDLLTVVIVPNQSGQVCLQSS